MQMPAAQMLDLPAFGFASRMKQKRIYVHKEKVLLPTERSKNLDFRSPWSSDGAKMLNIKIKKTKLRANVTR